MDLSYQIGKIVYSKAGRDCGRLFIVIDVLDDKYVYVCDGTLRPIEKPKKKKIKHLNFTNIVADDIKDSLVSGKKVNNSIIRKFLQSYDANEEV